MGKLRILDPRTLAYASRRQRGGNSDQGPPNDCTTADEDDRDPPPITGKWLGALRMIQKHKFVCHLYDRISGLTVEQIAEKVGIDKSTVSRRLARLRADVIAAFPELAS